MTKRQVQVAGKLGDSPCVGTVDGNSTSYPLSSTFSSSETELPTRGFLCNVKDGIRCDNDTRKCIAIGRAGEACSGSGSNVCTADAYCSSSSRTCVARKAVGAACEGFSSEEGAEGTYCDRTANKCAAALADGAACASSQACKSRSCVNGKCEANDPGSALLCGG